MPVTLARPDSPAVARWWPVSAWVVWLVAFAFAVGWTTSVFNAHDPANPPVGEVLQSIGWPLFVGSILVNLQRVYVRRLKHARSFDKLDDVGWAAQSLWAAMHRLGPDYDDIATEYWDAASRASMIGDSEGFRALHRHGWEIVQAAHQHGEARAIAERYAQLSIELRKDPKELG